MDNRDIFDEEYDKLNQNTPQQGNAFDSWAGHTPQQPYAQPKQQKRPWKIVLTCFALVACIALGWILCALSSSDQRKDLLSDVIDYMDYKFYEDISEEEWNYAVEQAGSVLMQYAGDRYSFLMSPQTYYDYMNNVGSTLTAASSMSELFGMTYTMDTKGMLISEVMPDSASYGKLYSNDLIVKMTDIKEYIPITDALGNYQWTDDGSLLVERNSQTNQPITKNSLYTTLLLEGATTSQVGAYLQLVYEATFHVLRDGEIVKYHIVRDGVGVAYDASNVDPNKRYDFDYVEYYFSQKVNNISLTPQNGAAVSIYEERGLANLPSNVGYVRIKQFDTLNPETDLGCALELRQALKLFKQNNLQYLVLDLKGNPGGYVHLTVEIAGMLINEDNLTPVQKNSVMRTSSSKTEYLVTSLVNREGQSQKQYVQSSYYDYFPEEKLSDGKKRICVWTDDGSASASELLTGCLLDYGTAVHFGTQTYGKGIAQTIEELPISGTVTNIMGIQEEYKWAVYYTFAKYYSPLGKNIHGTGYTPSLICANYNDLWTAVKEYWY